jgi:hypothetical protein
MKELQGQKDKLETDLSDINKELDLIRTKKIPELMGSMELRNVTIEGLGRVQLAADIYASTREGQKETAMTWLRDCGYDNMITETYNASSLKALFRRMISEGVDIPDDIFNIQPFIRASIVKA